MSNYNTKSEEINQESPTNEVEKKGNMLWGKSGDEFTIVSNYFIKPKYTKQLGLTPVERDLILVILTYKHNDNMPFPSYQRIANDMGVKDTRNIMAMVKKLESKKLLNVIRVSDDEKGHQSNRYDFNPLIKKLEQIVLKDKQEKSHEVKGSPHVVKNITRGSGVEYHKGSGVEHHPKKRSEKEIYKKENIYQSRQQKSYNIEEQPKKKKGKNRLTENDIQQTNLSIHIQVPLVKNIKVLQSNNISVNEIVEMYQENKDRMNDIELSNVLHNVLGKARNIKNFTGYIRTSVYNAIKEQQEQQRKENQSNEVIPDWFRKQQEERRKKQEQQEQMESNPYHIMLDKENYNFNKKGNDDWLADIE